jgi:hypothetical protein
MPRLWKFVYVAGGIFSILCGYMSLDFAHAAQMSADWILVTVAFVGTCLFPLGAMAYSRHIGVESFRRPSLDRPPIGWWRDTLQPLRVSLVGMALYFVGACFSLPKTDGGGLMIFWSSAAVTVGMFVGERLVYRIHAKRIG